MTLAPANSATYGSAGEPSSSAGAPSWRRRPSTSTPTRSASAAASSKSCVTSSAGSASSRKRSCSSARTFPRVCGSSAAIGSSRRRTRGPRASARAIAARCRSPPDSCDGLTRARCSICNRRSNPSARPPPKTTFCSTLRCGKSAYSWKTKPTDRSSGRRSMPLSESNQTSPEHVTRPRAGRARPAIARSTDVLPAPEGPTSATVSGPTSSASSRSKARSGSERSR